MDFKQKIAAYTLGCKVNMYDTQAMLALFSSQDYEVVEFSDAADIYIINTCTVTNLSDRKSRQMIRRARKLNPHALVVATGCYAQVAPEEVAKVEGVHLVLGTTSRGRIVEAVENFRRNGTTPELSDILTESEFENLWVDKCLDHTRGYLKIQEGCDRFCSYCIIPYARGPVRSRPADYVIEEVRRLAGSGFKEIVLAGIHVASYGKDLEAGNTLEALLEKIIPITGIERIRFSSLEPGLITERFAAFLASAPKICDHFHLSLQSGCDDTLRAMNRKYTTAAYAEAVNVLRRYYPHVAITTDIIVGFPGETDEHFRRSLNFVQDMGFARLHVFPYSPKKGTVAANMADQVADHIKTERSKQMLALGHTLQNDFITRALGQSVRVLFERQVSDGSYEGYTTNYMTVRCHFPHDVQNQIVKVEIKRIDGEIAFA